MLDIKITALNIDMNYRSEWYNISDLTTHLNFWLYQYLYPLQSTSFIGTNYLYRCRLIKSKALYLFVMFSFLRINAVIKKGIKNLFLGFIQLKNTHEDNSLTV